MPHILHFPLWETGHHRTAPQTLPAACCIAAQPSVREGLSSQLPQPRAGWPPHASDAVKSATAKVKTPVPTDCLSLLTFWAQIVAQAAPLWHLGVPQTLGWRLERSDCLLLLHRELAQILGGPSLPDADADLSSELPLSPLHSSRSPLPSSLPPHWNSPVVYCSDKQTGVWRL